MNKNKAIKEVKRIEQELKNPNSKYSKLSLRNRMDYITTKYRIKTKDLISKESI